MKVNVFETQKSTTEKNEEKREAKKNSRKGERNAHFFWHTHAFDVFVREFFYSQIFSSLFHTHIQIHKHKARSHSLCVVFVYKNKVFFSEHVLCDDEKKLNERRKKSTQHNNNNKKNPSFHLLLLARFLCFCGTREWGAPDDLWPLFWDECILREKNAINIQEKLLSEAHFLTFVWQWKRIFHFCVCVVFIAFYF